jgi:hypothetical protein
VFFFFSEIKHFSCQIMQWIFFSAIHCVFWGNVE